MTQAPIIIGIAGGTGSGKASLAQDLVRTLGPQMAAVLEVDAYYRDLVHLPPEDRNRLNFDHPRAIDTPLLNRHLKALGRGESIRKPVYDFSTHTRTCQAIDVSPCPVLLVEGILCLALAEIRECLDYSIFLDIPADIRFIRRLERDQRERGRTVREIIVQYRDQVRPMHERFVAPCRSRADLVLGQEDSQKMTARVMEIIASLGSIS